MKKVLLASTVLLAVAGAGVGWYVLSHRSSLQQAKVAISNGEYRSAGLQLRTAIRNNPSDAEAHALLAQLYIASDDAIAAEHEIREAMALHWDPASSLSVLSQAYMRQGKWEEILRDIPTNATTPEQAAFFLMTRAVAERAVKNVDESLATLAKAERLAPQNAEVHLVAARFAQQDGHLEHALDEVNRSLAIEPMRTDALQLKSALLLSKGEQKDALSELDRAIASAPARTDLIIERAALLLSMNRDVDAERDVEAALKRDPKNTAARFVNAVLQIRKSKYAEADKELQQIDPVLDRFQRGLYFKAMVKNRLGLNAQAEEAILAYLNRTPQDADGVRLLAQIELATQHGSRAIPYLVKAVQNGHRDSQTLDLLGRAYASAGNVQEAETVFKQASQSANNSSDLTRLASARLQVGDLTGAAGDLQRSLDIAPKQPGAAEALVATALRLGQLERAQQALEQLRQNVGETEAVGNLSGLLKLAQLDPQGAIDTFRKTAQRFPDATAPRLNEAKVLAQLNQTDDAITLLQRVLEKSPTEAEALTLYVQLLLQQGRGPEAVEAAERARKMDPNNIGLINGEAQLYARMQQYAKAIDVLNTAKVAEKMPVQLLPTLGSIQLAAGQTDAAKRTFADLVTAEPTNVAAILSTVEVLSRLKDFDAARRTLDTAIQRLPMNIQLLQAKVRIDLIDGGLDRALQTADSLSSNATHMPAAATLKGGVLMGVQKFRDAVAAFRTEYVKNPSSALVIGLAQALNASGDANAATTELTNWQSSHPDDAAVAQLLGTFDITAQRYDSAERNFLLVLRSQPNDLVALNDLAWLYQRKGDKRAREYAQRAFEQAPTPEVTDTFAWILTQDGDAAKAVPLLASAAKARPQSQAIQYHLAVALKDTGKTAEAIEVLRAIVGSPSQFDDRPAAQALLTDLSKQKP